jgi:hypothetical protein
MVIPYVVFMTAGFVVGCLFALVLCRVWWLILATGVVIGLFMGFATWAGRAWS